MDDKKTNLYQTHVELGAKFTEFAGYSMPLQYKHGVMKEHLHTRKSAGLFDVSHMGQIMITSKEKSFSKLAEVLETLMPADLKSLSVNRQCYSFLTTNSGGLLDDLIVSNLGNKFILVVNASRKKDDYEYIVENIGNYCNIELIEDRSLIALQGPLAEKVLVKFSNNFAALQFLDIKKIEVLGEPCLVSRSGYTGEDGFELSVPNSIIEKLVQEILIDGTVMPVGLGARDSLRLEAGLCLYGQELNETITPVEASLGWAIHKARRLDGARPGGFKGDKKILSQLKYGSLNRRVGLEPEGRAPVRKGSNLYESLNTRKKIGYVTSGGFSPTLQKPISMAFVNAEFSKIGSRIFADLRGDRVPMVVSKLPFINRSYKY